MLVKRRSSKVHFYLFGRRKDRIDKFLVEKSGTSRKDGIFELRKGWGKKHFVKRNAIDIIR